MIPIRVVKAIMAFLCSANIYISRTNVNIGIIKMVRPKSSTGGDSSSCHSTNVTTLTMLNASEAESEWEFDWDDVQQGNMLGAYFYGYAAGMPLGGFWSNRYGPSRTTLVSMAIGTVLTFLYPFLITFNYHVGFAARILLGFAHSPNFPVVQGSWHSWAPITEKTKLVTSMFLGVPAGSLVMSMLGGRLCLWFGWRSVFWFAGVANVLFVVLWFMFVTDTPEEHRLISEREKAFIIASRVKQGAAKDRKKPPIKNFFTSLPMVACWVAHTTSLYAAYCVVLFFPKYLSDVQGFNIKDIGDLAAMPQALVVFIIFGGGFISDKLHARGVELIKIRRVMNFMGSVVPALVWSCFFFVRCDIVSAMAIMILGSTLTGLQHPSSKANFNDVVPPYAATAMSIGNTFGSIMGFVAPAFAGSLLKTFGNTVAIWNIIWLICAGVLFGGGVFFTCFSSAEPLPWATDDGIALDDVDDETEALKK